MLSLLLQGNSARGSSATQTTSQPSPTMCKAGEGVISGLLEVSGTEQWENEGPLTGMAGGGKGLGRDSSLDGHDV